MEHVKNYDDEAVLQVMFPVKRHVQVLDRYRPISRSIYFPFDQLLHDYRAHAPMSGFS